MVMAKLEWPRISVAWGCSRPSAWSGWRRCVT